GQGVRGVSDEARRLRDEKNTPAAGSWPSPQEVTVTLAEGLLTGRFAIGVAHVEGDVASADPRPDDPADPHGAGAAASSPSAASRSPLSETSVHWPDQTQAQYFRSVAEVGAQVAEARAYAHKQGSVHRDIKPSNLLLDTCGTVWITDFGLAKSETSEELTSPGDVLGTVRYMAPERFQGKADARSDVYSLGSTLYELLAGRPAFAESHRARLIEQVTREEPPRPRKLDPQVPRDLETIVLRAMAKEPSERYASALDVAEDLRRFLADRPIQARRSSLAERGWRWCRRNPVMAALIGLAALLLVVIAGGASLATIMLGNQLQRTEEAERDAKDKLWRSLLERARAARFSKQ